MVAITLQIIAQTDDFIVINKPANINFHDEGDIGSGLFSQVKLLLNIDELYPVHRLDKMTSGLIVFAKNLITAQQFQLLFEQHQVEKYYLAISDNKPQKKQGLISGDMEKSRRGTWKLLRSQKNPAISQFFSYALTHGKRLFIIKPHTGRTHQIRVALNSLGAPIIGDPSYHKSSLADRGYLHAYALCFTLNNQTYQYICQPVQGDEYCNSTAITCIESLNQPWLLPWPKLK